jgi:hypothetical protein
VKSHLRFSKASGSTKRRVEIMLQRGYFRRRSRRALEIRGRCQRGAYA